MPEPKRSPKELLDSLAEAFDQISSDTASTEGKTTKVALLDKQLANKHDQLFRMEGEIKAQDRAMHEKAKENKEYIERLEGTVKYKQQLIDAQDKKLQADKTTLEELHKEIVTAKKDLKDSKDYLVEQEKVVNQTIAEWNDQLTGFSQAGGEMDSKKQELLAQNVRLEQDIVALETTTKELASKHQQLDAAYQEKVTEYREQLTTLDNQVANKQDEIKAADLQIANRLKALESREQAIRIAEQRNTDMEGQLADKQKKLKLDYKLAGATYE